MRGHNICFLRDGSNEGSQHRFSLRNKKVNLELSSDTPFTWSAECSSLVSLC